MSEYNPPNLPKVNSVTWVISMYLVWLLITGNYKKMLPFFYTDSYTEHKSAPSPLTNLGGGIKQDALNAINHTGSEFEKAYSNVEHDL